MRLLCFNDLTALGLMSGCAQIGRPVGTDLRIVGFDDIEECAEAFPALSSVRCDIAAFGRRWPVRCCAGWKTAPRHRRKPLTPVELDPPRLLLPRPRCRPLPHDHSRDRPRALRQPCSTARSRWPIRCARWPHICRPERRRAGWW
jgi:hypothetical protein